MLYPILRIKINGVIVSSMPVRSTFSSIREANENGYVAIQSVIELTPNTIGELDYFYTVSFIKSVFDPNIQLATIMGALNAGENVVTELLTDASTVVKTEHVISLSYNTTIGDEIEEKILLITRRT
jgi:hypothetical protein